MKVGDATSVRRLDEADVFVKALRQLEVSGGDERLDLNGAQVGHDVSVAQNRSASPPENITGLIFTRVDVAPPLVKMALADDLIGTYLPSR